MKKHAYLIIAHNNFEQLKKLINLLDYEFNDIYIHIDPKSKNFDINILYREIKVAKLNIYKEIDVRWGGYSQIEVELFLLKKAIKGNYCYYHLLSGNDLPIKNQEKIYQFFLLNKGYEFIDFENTNTNDRYKERIKYYYIFNDYIREKNKVKCYLKKYIRFIFLFLQKILKVNRCETKKIVKKGSNWFSITHECALFVINNEKLIRKEYKYGNCVDEIFLQTLIYNSNFFQNVYKSNEKYNLAFRYIDWEHGSPYVFKKNDFQRLISCNALFARKFDEKVDKDIVNLVCKYIKNENSNFRKS